MTVEIICGERRHEIHLGYMLKVDCNAALGCALLGGNDLYDLGFTYSKIKEHGITIVVDGRPIVHIEDRHD